MEDRAEMRQGTAACVEDIFLGTDLARDLVADALGRARVRANGLLTPDPQTGPVRPGDLRRLDDERAVARRRRGTPRPRATWPPSSRRSPEAPRALIGLQALGNPDLLALPLMALASVELEALLAFGDLDHVSLWTSAEGEPEPVACRGITMPPDGVQAAAAALAGRPPPSRTAARRSSRAGSAATPCCSPRVPAWRTPSRCSPRPPRCSAPRSSARR